MFNLLPSAPRMAHLIHADWLEENDKPVTAAAIRQNLTTSASLLSFYDRYRCFTDGWNGGDGDGDGEGDGNGDGDGWSASDSKGKGSGKGNGYGDGCGAGSGSGEADGFGQGHSHSYME